jgi:hypothetical protein
MQDEPAPDDTVPGDAGAGGTGEPATGPPDPDVRNGVRSDDPGEDARGQSGTGEPRVDAALKLLERLPDLAVSQHAQLFEQVHAQLAEVLAELDPGQEGT